MITLITVAPIFFLLCVAAGAAVMSRAQRGLTLEEKAAVFDAAPKRQWLLLVAMALVIAAFTLPTLHGDLRRWSFPVFSVVVFVLVTASTGSYMRRLSRFGTPPAYLRAVRLSMWVLWIAGFLFFATLTYGMWRLFPR
jgi:hypothetical protein